MSIRKQSQTFSDNPRDYQNYIDGAFVTAGSELIEVTNPATGLFFVRVPLTTAHYVDRAVQAARSSHGAWSRLLAS